MKKRFVVLLMIMLGLLFVGNVSADDYGFTELSMIPGAVPFNILLTLDSEGKPVVETDYPFVDSGAEEMEIDYVDFNGNFMFSLAYNQSDSSVSVRSWMSNLFPDNDPDFSAIYQAIREGNAVPGNQIMLGKRSVNGSLGWCLEYDSSTRSYSRYSYGNQLSAFDGTMWGETQRSVYYNSRGRISFSEIFISLEDGSARLRLEYDRYGQLTEGRMEFGPDSYYLDTETGLFDGRSVTEFGYDPDILNTDAPAALDSSQRSEIIAESLSGPNERTAKVGEIFDISQSDYHFYPEESLIDGFGSLSEADFFIDTSDAFWQNATYTRETTDTGNILYHVTPNTPGYYPIRCYAEYDGVCLYSNYCTLTVLDEDGNAPELKEINHWINWPRVAPVGSSYTMGYWWENAIEPWSFEIIIEHNGKLIAHTDSYPPPTIDFTEKGDYVLTSTVTDALGRISIKTLTTTVTDPGPLKAGKLSITKIQENGPNDYEVWMDIDYTGGYDIATIHLQFFAADDLGNWHMNWEQDELNCAPRHRLGEDGYHYFKAQISDGVDTIEMVSDVIFVGQSMNEQKLVLPNDLTEIEDEAFMNNNAITNVVAPSGLKQINSKSFAGCTCLQKIFIPSGIQYIAPDAFLNVPSLTIVTDQKTSLLEAFAQQNGFDLELESSID